MVYAVQFTIAARQDLRGIRSYIAEHDSPAKADYVVRAIIRIAMSLRELPFRGALVPELEQYEKPDFRQICFKPYRIFYRVMDANVYVALVADGRRDMVTLLARRLTQP